MLLETVPAGKPRPGPDPARVVGLEGGLRLLLRAIKYGIEDEDGRKNAAAPGVSRRGQAAHQGKCFNE